MNMKRVALLVGNSNGLAGVKIDLAKFKSFLMSNQGGAWNSDEIIELHHATKSELIEAISFIKSLLVDYCVVYFSGHGAYIRKVNPKNNETILELEDENLVEESVFNNLAERQLTILDCCRNVVEIPICDGLQPMMESINLNEYKREAFRKKYNLKIMGAIPQHAKLYSCSIGESSIATSDGSIYTEALWEAVKMGAETVNQVHDKATDFVIKYWNYNQQDKNLTQNPKAKLPKCLTSQQLIFCVSNV